ncbi:hypothetical protein EIK77_006894 [Talaromyces pinophilus]|jgi:protein N-lysine methyltransferase METTL21A|nr:hypothetical protein EIK77_006894 [Talaromyces pinophilus]
MEESNLASPAQQQIPNTSDDAETTHTYFSSTEPGSPADDSDNSQLLIGESLIPVRERKHAGTTVVTIDGLLKEPLQLKEDLKQGCGGQLWPAGLLLSRYMLEEHATDLVGKTMFVHPPSDTTADSTVCSVAYILGLFGWLTDSTIEWS